MKTAIVIGAGPAGLTAAHELVAKGEGAWRILVLEESSALGGISRTVVHGDCRIDIGGRGPDAVFDAEEQAVRILGQTGGGRMRCVSLHAGHDHLLALPHARPVGGDGNHRLPVVLFPSCLRLSACARGRYALVCDGHLRQAHLHPVVGGSDFGSHADPERRLVEEGDDDVGLWTGACRLFAPVDGAQQACVRNGGIDNDFGHEPLCVQLGASGRTAAVRRKSEGTGVHEEI